MVLIPPDAGIRMRMQTDATLLQPVQPTHEIPADLPELQPGQAFSARIMETLPDNTYKALVAGKLLTLQLPEGAKPGDTLELVVVDRTARSIVAQRTDAQSSPNLAAQPYANANISRAGQMIGQLLLPEGQSPQPVPLNRGEPLLSQAPATAAELAPTLAKAVSQSGLFYEAHQAEWVAGRRPMESLQAEPHGQVKVAAGAIPTPASAAAAADSAPVAAATPGATTTGEADKAVQQGANAAQAVPDQLRPLVQQQLDAVATQRLAWHGEVWPGQVMDLQIERERTEERDAGDEREGAQRWNTTLRLTMPRLGTIDATLQLSGSNLWLRLAAGDTATADLRANAAELVQALGAAGVSMQSFEVENESG